MCTIVIYRRFQEDASRTDRRDEGWTSQYMHRM